MQKKQDNKTQDNCFAQLFAKCKTKDRSSEIHTAFIAEGNYKFNTMGKNQVEPGNFLSARVLEYANTDEALIIYF